MNKYLIRAAKCLFKLMILLSLVFAVMILTNTMDTQGMTVFRAIFMTWRGAVLIALVVIWSLAYPVVSFTTSQLRMNMNENRETIINAFACYNYALESESDGVMVFRVKGIGRRILWQFDDPITVTQDGGFMDIEGLKKIVPRVETRLKAMTER